MKIKWSSLLFSVALFSAGVLTCQIKYFSWQSILVAGVIVFLFILFVSFVAGLATIMKAGKL